MNCPKCGSLMRWREGHGRFGPFLGCPAYPACDIIHNAFGFSDQPTRNARKRAHAAFDRLWKPSRRTRGYLYKILAIYMGLPQSKCHIEGFGIEQCERVLAFAQEYAPKEQAT